LFLVHFPQVTLVATIARLESREYLVCVGIGQAISYLSPPRHRLN